MGIDASSPATNINQSIAQPTTHDDGDEVHIGTQSFLSQDTDQLELRPMKIDEIKLKKVPSPTIKRNQFKYRKPDANRSKIEIHSIDGRSMLAKSVADSRFLDDRHQSTHSQDQKLFGSSFYGTNHSQVMDSAKNGGNKAGRMQLPKINLPINLLTQTRDKKRGSLAENVASASRTMGHSLFRETITASTSRRKQQTSCIER